MGCDCYERGEEVTLYCSFLSGSEEPTTITDPKITISHVDGSGVFTVDVNEADLVHMSENTYFYKWTIPESVVVGFYNVECQANLDGDYGERNYTIKVN